MAMFDDLTEAETRTLMRMLREGYTKSRGATKWLRGCFPDGVPADFPQARMLLSARTGSLAGVRSDLTWINSDLLNHMRELERQ